MEKDGKDGKDENVEIIYLQLKKIGIHRDPVGLLGIQLCCGLCFNEAAFMISERRLG